MDIFEHKLNVAMVFDKTFFTGKHILCDPNVFF